MICAGGHVVFYHVKLCINGLGSPLLILVCSNLANWRAVFKMRVFYLSLLESGEH